MRTTKLALGSAAALAVLGLAPVAAALTDDSTGPADPAVPAGSVESPAPSDGGDPCVTETIHPAEQVAGGEIGAAVAENVCE